MCEARWVSNTFKNSHYDLKKFKELTYCVVRKAESFRHSDSGRSNPNTPKPHAL